MQVDKICTFDSEVIDVESLCNYWHPKNRVFNFSGTGRVKQN